MKQLSIVTFLTLFALLSAARGGAYAQSYSSLADENHEYSRLRVGVQGGWGYRVGKVNPNLSSEMQEHHRKLKSGYTLGADATFYFVRDIGIGARFHQFYSSHTAKKASIDGLGSLDLVDEIGLTYAAPQISTRYLLGRHSIMIDISAGYLAYRNYSYMGYDYRVNGSTIGYGSNIGYDFAITPKLSIGISFCAVAGQLSKVRIGAHGKSYDETLPEDQRENLNHMTVTAGLRFTL